MWAWRGYLGIATLSWLLFRYETLCLALSKSSYSSNKHFNSSLRVLKACYAVKSHRFVLTLGLVPCNKVSGWISKENACFM